MTKLNNILLSLCTALAIFISCDGIAGTLNDFEWSENGQVTTPSKQVVKLDVDGLNNQVLTYNGDLYIEAYRFIKERESNFAEFAGVDQETGRPKFNYIERKVPQPLLVRIDGETGELNYWSFEQNIQQLFVYQNELYTLFSDGTSLVWLNNLWTHKGLQLEPYSKVIAHAETLIACYPSLLAKSSKRPRIGACYTNKWQHNVNWVNITPKVCGEHLIAKDTVEKKLVVKGIRISDGEITFTKPVVALPNDLCEVVTAP